MRARADRRSTPRAAPLVDLDAVDARARRGRARRPRARRHRARAAAGRPSAARRIRARWSPRTRPSTRSRRRRSCSAAPPRRSRGRCAASRPAARSTEVAGDDVTPAAAYPDLAGKVAVVTGGSAGHRRRDRELLAANGVQVAISAAARGRSRRSSRSCAAHGAEAIGFTADASSADDMARLRDAGRGRAGPGRHPDPVRRRLPLLHAGRRTSPRRSGAGSSTTTSPSTFLTIKPFLAGDDRAPRAARS